MARTPFKMKGWSPFTKKEFSEEAKNLLKVVPNEEAYNKLSDMDKKSFDEAAKKYGLPQKKSPAKNYKKGYYGA